MQDVPQYKLLDVEKLPVEKATETLIEYATGLPASDLFLITNPQHVAVQVRHLGMIRMISVLSPEHGRRIMSHVKARAGIDIAERRRPTDGRWIFTPEEGDAVDLRINTIPSMYGEDFAIRLLSRASRLHSMELLGLDQRQRLQIDDVLESPGGLVLITGPTGCGKTTTLYACLSRLNNGKRKINTIEDPIELSIEGLRQSQVNPVIGIGFAELLRSVMRQSPDVIMIGEIRDPQTAETAVRAANSGHMVFATLHAATAAAAVQSMRALGVHPHFLSTSLKTVIAQRLVRTLCDKCKTAFDLDEAPHTFDEIKPWLAPGEGKALYAATGCEACNMAGYAGRTGVFEIMTISRSIRNLISDGASTRKIREKAIEEKMAEFRQAALLKVARGETSTEEVFRNIPSEYLLLDD